MHAKSFDTAHLSELDAIPVSGTLVWRPIRRRFDIGAFGVNAYTAANAGDELVEDHDELGSGGGEHEELYYVASGHATFSVDGQEVTLPRAPWSSFATGRSGTPWRRSQIHGLAVGGPRGEASTPAWELWFAARPHVEAASTTRPPSWSRPECLTPDNPSLLYNPAATRSLPGTTMPQPRTSSGRWRSTGARARRRRGPGPGLDPRRL